MNGTFFYIGLGLGLAAACGLRPYLPRCWPACSASAGALGVAFTGPAFHFLQAGWWLIAVALVLATPTCCSLRLGPGALPGRSSQPAIVAQALAVGALLFAGTLAAHGDAWWPGLIGGFLAAGLALRASGPVILRARTTPARPRRARSGDRVPRRRLAAAGRPGRARCIRSATSRSRCSPGSSGAVAPAAATSATPVCASSAADAVRTLPLRRLLR